MCALDRRGFVKLVSTSAISLIELHNMLGLDAALASSALINSHHPLAVHELAEQFASPPEDARPWVYWFWLDGNLTREGITADLEAMKRVGIGGVLIMEVDQGTPPGAVHFMSVEWQEMFKFVCEEAERLGLQVNMDNAAGWCGSGGPWITPDISMQRVVWTETHVNGGDVNLTLPQPTAAYNYYQDIQVSAFPTPPSEKSGTGYRLPNFQNLSLGGGGGAEDDIPTSADWPVIPDGEAVKRAEVRNLSIYLDPAGRLECKLPEGEWTVMRFGHTTTGVPNHPAPEGGLGLESDKLSKIATTFHFRSLIEKLAKDVHPLAGRSLVSTHIDSWETGTQNWTPTMRADFKRLRGYDCEPFMPALAGRVVDSIAVTQRFLWDWRKTISDLLVENYAVTMRNLANQQGLRLSIEGYSGVPAIEMEYGGVAVEPMSECWSWPRYGSSQSVTEMTSAGHVYGRRIIGQETCTAGSDERWQGHPANVKAICDWTFCQGVNRFVFHRFAMQPWTNPHYAPGMSMGPWGLHYERTQTWWEMSHPWHDYVSRCQHLLRQGLFVADILYMQAEGAPEGTPTMPGAGDPSYLPKYKHDACPTDVVLHHLAVKDGRLVLPDGMSYRVLVLPDSPTMTPELLRRLIQLVRDGATIIGSPPKKSPSLVNYPNCDDEVAHLAHDLWNSGKIISTKTAEQVLEERGVLPDCSSDADTAFCHRTMPDADIYFVCNRTDWPVTARMTFRIANRAPELWNPQTGRIVRTAAYECNRDTTAVSLNLEPYGSVFVVFRKGSTASSSVVKLFHNGNNILTSGWGSTAARDLQIVSASYGPPEDSTRTRNVEGIVRNLINHGRLSFPVVEIANIGGDPAYGVVKTLTVTFNLTGKKHTVSAQDGDTFSFAHRMAVPAVTIASVYATGKGIQLCAGSPGNYTCRLNDGTTRTVDVTGPLLPLSLEGPWHLSFPEGWGAPPSVTLPHLISWSEHAHEGIRYFSGTAQYRTTLELPRAMHTSDAPGIQLLLDLGVVAVMATVYINGKLVGTCWKRPYVLDVTHYLHIGANTVEVRVANLWINRLIGDQQLPEDCNRAPDGHLISWPKWLEAGQPSPTGRLTFTTWQLWHKTDPLQESGLLGPVRLIPIRSVMV